MGQIIRIKWVGSYLFGHGKRPEAHQHKIRCLGNSTSATVPPFQTICVWCILRASPTAAGPCSGDAWFLVILCLIPLLKCVLARLFLDINVRVTFLKHNYHFGHRYGRFWCPEPVIWQAGCSSLAPWGTMGRSRGTWEQKKGDLGIQAWMTESTL